MKKKLVSAILCIALLSIGSPVMADESIPENYFTICERVGNEYGICPELLEAMIFYESAGNPKAVSSCGAVGLMQVRPEFNKERMERLGVTDLTDPEQNIQVGADIIAELAESYEVYDALAAYNNGEFSKKFENVRNGESCDYAEKILEKSANYERLHGK